MENIIKVYNCIGTQGRSRVNASKLNIASIPSKESVVLDFDNVDFLSRSFTDEIITILGSRNYRIVNANSIIENMFKAVVNGRNKPRKHEDNGAIMLRFDNMADLSKYLNSSI